jgi:hypothetical protein
MNRDDLKNRIKILAEQGRTLQGKIQATAGPERHSLWNEKRAIGRKARVSLLAYGFLRGMAYRRIEPRRHDDGLLIPSVLLGTWASDLGIPALHPYQAVVNPKAHSPGRTLLGDLTAWLLRREDTPPESFWTQERVAAWLDTPAAAADREAAVR